MTDLVADIAFLDRLSLPACILTPRGAVFWLNAEWRRRAALGTPCAAAFSLRQLVHAEDADEAMAPFRAGGARTRPRDIECRLPDAATGSRWFLLGFHAFEDRASGVRNWLCMGTDIHALKQREAMQTSMLSGSIDCIKLINLDGTLLHMNRAGCVALGVAEDSGFGMPWLPLLPEEIRAPGEEALAAARAGTCFRFPGRSELPGQKPLYWDNLLTPVLGPDMKPSSILCVSREVTAEQEALALLRESQERLQIATRTSGLGIWDYHIERDELYCDESWYRIMGRDPAQPVRSVAEFRPFIHPEDVDRATDVNVASPEFMEMGQDYTIKFRIIHPNGEIRWVRSAACLLRDETGVARRAIGFVVDITAAWEDEQALRDSNRALEEEKTSLVQQNLEDPLTGLANRRHLDREFPRICREAQDGGHSICVGMVDVDYFKAYNDRYGHVQGDVVLRDVAAALKAASRRSDLVARYGGEEFAFVLVDTEKPGPLIDRFMATVADLRIRHEASSSGYLTVSCGCLVVRARDVTLPRRLLQQSDELLYEAKTGGRSRSIIRYAEALPATADNEQQSA